MTTSTPDEAIERLSRFSDSTINEFCELGLSKSHITHYSGNIADDRMVQIRKQIEFIREEARSFPELTSALREYLLENHTGPTTDQFENALRTLTETTRNWTEEIDDFGALRLYTSKYGYDFIFGALNAAFRDQHLTQREQRVRDCVFLIELLNIDLFHWHQRNPTVRNYCGIVYRGMTVSEEGLQHFEKLSQHKVRDRYWSVPLSMMSASEKVDKALEFAMTQARKGANLPRLLLLRIHVVSLPTEAVELYRKHFPTSIVTSLCAVPIAALSVYQSEEEVLLRGPWFQLVRLEEEEFDGFGKIHVMDNVMVTGNRDHPSTMALRNPKDKDSDYNFARDLFSALNWIERMDRCASLAEQYGRLDDATEFRQAYFEEISKRDNLVKRISSGRNV